jgi:hypothetical protein
VQLAYIENPLPEDTTAKIQTGVDVYLDGMEKARQARAASEIARVLGNENYTVYHPETPAAAEPSVSPGHGAESDRARYDRAQHQAIPLDSNGEPIGDFAERDFGPPPAATKSFADNLANQPELENERSHNARVEELRAAAAAGSAATQEVKRQLGFDIPESAIDDERRAGAWVPPSSPGGIALDPTLQLPLDAVGTPQKIESDGAGIILVTDRGRFRIDGIAVRSFATIARAIAVGEIPYLSIGSEVSDRPGYARVTYAPALQGTVEGHALYDADIQFKTIFAKLPLTRDAAAQTLAPLFADFPGPGGDFVRFWITSSNIVLRADGDHLVTVDSGMRVNSETRLNFSVRSDPEMQAYTDKLTQHWDEIASALPSFRAVQNLALVTAVVFWARDHGVPIDPIILTIPPETSLTPDYAPLVGALDSNFMITGGVALTPEDRDTALGHAFLSQIGYDLNLWSTLMPLWAARSLFGLYGLAIMALALLLPALILRRTTGARFSQSLRIWALVCAAEIVIVASLRPLILGDVLSFFDRNLLALLSTLVLFPVLLFAVIRRWLDEPLADKPWRRRTTLALGLAGPLVAGALGLGLAYMTIAATGPVPSLLLNRVLTAEVAPFEAFGEGIATVSLAPGERRGHLVLVPQSLIETQRPDVVLHHFTGASDDTIDPSSNSRFFPSGRLKKISWPKDRPPRPGVTYYSTDGRPPF